MQAVKVSWDNAEQTIIRYDFKGKWNWNALYEANELAFYLMSQVDHEVNVIFNMKNSAELPTGAFNGIRDMFGCVPFNMGSIVLTHGTTIAEYTFEMLSEFEDALGARFAIADTLETARDMFSDEWAFLAG